MIKRLALALAAILAASPAAALNTQARRALIPSQWMPAAPAINVDCLLGAIPAAVSTVRATAELIINPATGIWTSIAANTLARNIQGCAVWEQRTNRALRSRDFTQTAWVKTNATAALDQTGIQNDATQASSLTATGANATILQAITDATSRARVTSAFVQRLAGTGEVDMTMDGGTTWVPIAPCAAATFIGRCRVSIPVQTNVNPTVGFRLVVSGDKIAVDFFQTEDPGAAVSPPILTTTAAVQRNFDNISQTTSLPALQNTFSVAASGLFNYPTSAANFPTLVTLEFGAVANRIAISSSQTGTTNLKINQNGGSGGVGLLFDWPDGPAPGNVGTSYARDGVNGQAWIGNSSVTNTSYLYASPNTFAAPMNRLDVGSIAGGNSTNGYVRRIWVWPNIILTRDQARAMARLVR